MRIGVSATGKLNRKDYGLTWNVVTEAGGLLVGDDVKLSIDAEFVKVPEPAEAVVKAVMSGLHLVADLNYCGRVARPKLAWLCEQAAQEIGAVLRRHFGTET